MRSGYLSLILLDSAWRFSVEECEVGREIEKRRCGENERKEEKKTSGSIDSF